MKTNYELIRDAWYYAQRAADVFQTALDNNDGVTRKGLSRAVRHLKSATRNAKHLQQRMKV